MLWIYITFHQILPTSNNNFWCSTIYLSPWNICFIKIYSIDLTWFSTRWNLYLNVSYVYIYQLSLNFCFTSFLYSNKQWRVATWILSMRCRWWPERLNSWRNKVRREQKLNTSKTRNHIFVKLTCSNQSSRKSAKSGSR